jgi:hypothetical protein
MKRRIALPTLAIIIAPLALGVSSVSASGGDDDHDDTEQENESSDSSVPTSGAPSSSVAPAPGAPPTSIPTSTPSGSSRFAELRAKLNGLLTRIGQTSIPDSVKQDLRARVDALLTKLASGQRIESRDLEAIAKAIENAVRAARPATSSPTATPSTIDDDSDEDDSNDDSDDSVVSIPGSTSGDDSSGRPRFDIDKVRRDGNQVRGDLAANITKAITALETLPQSEARDAVLASLAALHARVEAGETIPFDEVRNVFDAVARLVYERIGDGADDDEVPAPGEVPGEMQRQRMLGSVTEALALLAGNTTDAGTQAITALEALKITLEAGEMPTRDAYENAMRLTREALQEIPASKALLTLAGVIAAVNASDMPADVKAELLIVLNAAKDRLINDPAADPGQVVRDALNQVREARIAASVQKMLAIAARLETEATEAGNADAVLMITEARALLQPSDASLPDRDDLHHARRILVRVAILLRATTPPTTTVPPTTDAPTTDAPTTDAPTTTAV